MKSGTPKEGDRKRAGIQVEGGHAGMQRRRKGKSKELAGT